MSEDQYMGNLYQRFPVTVEKGKGAHVWDINGKEYIDCMGGYGVAIVGHQNERVVKAIKDQVDKIITVHSSLYNKTREEFLKTLIDLAPKGLSQVHLNNSGAEAIEAAIKFARKFTGKKGRITSYNVCYTKLLRFSIRSHWNFINCLTITIMEIFCISWRSEFYRIAISTCKSYTRNFTGFCVRNYK